MDKAARAAQLARCIAHTGDPFVYTPAGGGAAVSFSANPVDEPVPAEGDKTRLGQQAPRIVRLTAARALFAAKLPAAGEWFTTPEGFIYRITAVPDIDPSKPTVAFLCTVSKPAPVSAP